MISCCFFSRPKISDVVLKLPVITIVLGLQNYSIKSSFFYKDQMPSVLFSYNWGTIIVLICFQYFPLYVFVMFSLLNM